jgi:pyruvate dehydrogenase E1 component
VILHHGLKRMVEKQDNVFFYLTLLNENYPMPGLKPGTEEQIIKGMYLLEEGAKKTPRVNLLGSGTILRESQEARKLLEADWGVAANVWSCPSFNELARDGQDCERWNLLHPTAEPRVPFVTAAAGGACRPGGGSHRLHEELRRADPRLHPQGAPGLQGAGHRRLRPQRLPQQAARALRDQPPLHRGGGAEGAGRRRHVPLTKVAEAIARSTASTPTSVNPLYA